MRPRGGNPECSIWVGQIPAEPFWADPNTARLPTLGVDRRSWTDGLEELLFVLCGDGDILMTRQPRSAELAEYQESLGFNTKSSSAAGRAWLWPATESENGKAADLLRSGYRLRSYAVTPAITEFASRNGAAGDLPPAEAVRRVNSKTWSTELSREHGFRNAGVVIRSCEEFSQLGTSMLGCSPVVVKEPFGVSGLGSVRVDTAKRLDRLLRHLSRQEAAGRAVELILEPFAGVEVSFSAHFDLESAGRWQLRGFQQTRNDGFKYSSSAALRRSLADKIDVGRLSPVIDLVAGRLHAEGYFGPVCMDSLLLADGTVVPVCELNCRISMGRLNITLDSALESFGCTSYLTSLVLVSGSAVSPSDVLELLRKDDLLFAPGNQKGVIPLTGLTLPKAPEADRTSAAGRLYLSVPSGSDSSVVRRALADVAQTFRRADIQARAADTG